MDGLTPTELACLHLAQRSNKDIAAQLHLSVKTVECYLSVAYRNSVPKTARTRFSGPLGKGILRPEDIWGKEI